MYETRCQSRFSARCWMLGAGALGRPRGMVWGGRREEGSGWGARVYLKLKKLKKKKNVCISLHAFYVSVDKTSLNNLQKFLNLFHVR